ncbi:precorrin-6A reductase [Desulfuribacillus alkaliarsenatis]|uniref:Precorrin-6x reductase n=1 Tax=Desulfuribacillus alkaliarsenatis TaxID=766136 RepID=A0A1E5G4H6_9FIRM|nr:precorrin-6A reductase [Desulfuribacillus alkaliarsenatis]OEF97993.1 precorrin-6x reductase [Desulfuribacillus alkaliarsenatis]
MIFVLAGTTESRAAISALQNAGHRVGASVVTAFGSNLLTRQGVTYINQGRFDEHTLTTALLDNQVQCLVDATHPYAIEISKLAMKVAAALQIPYIRYERQAGDVHEHPLVKHVQNLEEVETLIKPNQRVFSTLGSKSLPVLVPMMKRVGAELIVRVLPCTESIQLCEQIGVDLANIVAMKGPFTEMLNTALFRQYNIDVMLTKESGHSGGFHEKIKSASELDITSLVIRRPELLYPEIADTIEQLIEKVTGVGIEQSNQSSAHQERCQPIT